jgi:hypothetical protein
MSVAGRIERTGCCGEPDRRRLSPKSRQKRRGPRSIGQVSQGAQGLVGAAGQAGDHVIGIDPNTFELGYELANYFRVRHPAPDSGGRGRPSLRRLRVA